AVSAAGASAVSLSAASDILQGANVSSGSGTITLTAGRDIGLNSGNVSTTGNVNVTASAGSISDGNLAANNVTAASLTASAGTAIGTSLDPVDIQVANLTATASNGGVFFLEADGLTIVSATASGAGNDVEIATTSGDIIVDVIAAADDVVLTASAGSIRDDNDNTTRISGDQLTMSASIDIGAPLTGPQVEQIDTAVNSITASTSLTPNAGTHGIWITDSDAVTLTSVTTADGLVRISAGDSITATLVTAGGTGRNVTLITTAGTGNIAVGAVTALGDRGTLTAVGAVTAANGPTNNVS